MSTTPYPLSVILPVYNAAPWLADCIGSIRRSAGEEFETIELLLVDDGSTDESGSLCDGAAAQHPNIRAFHKPNGGVASARNLGLDHARGQYIAWVDPDDLVAEDWFPAIREAIGQGGPDVIVMDSLRFGDGPEIPETYGRPGGNVDRDTFAEDVVRDIRMLSGMPNKVMKAALFQGVRFDENLPILEDYAAILSILEPARTVYHIPQPLYLYRQHPGSLLHSGSASRAFLSVETALARERAVPARFHAAAVTAVAIQAFKFCWNHHTSPDFGASRAQLRFCRRYIRGHLPTLLRDAEISKTTKMKLTLMGFGMFSVIFPAESQKEPRFQPDE